MSSQPIPTLSIVVRHLDDEEIDKRPLSFVLIKRLLMYAVADRATCTWLFVLVVLRSAQLPTLAWTLSSVISGPIERHDWHGTLFGAVLYFSLACVTEFTFHFRQRLGLQLGESVVHDLRKELFAHLLTLPMGFYHRTKLGRILGRFSSDVELVRSGVQDVVFVSIVQIGQMLGAALFMVFCDWRLFIVVLVLAPVLWSINRLFRERMSQASRQSQESFSRVTANLAESVNGIRVTQGFVRQQVNAGMFASLIADHARFNLRIERVNAVFTPLLDINIQVFMAALLLLGGYLSLLPAGNVHIIQVGVLINFFFIAGNFFEPLKVLGNQYRQALASMAGAERVFRLLDTVPDWRDQPDARTLPQITGHITFSDVHFAYDPGRMVLHGISFAAEPGQTIALVGHTGCGKSTIINLLAKFYLAHAGTVAIDGHDIRTVTGESLHRQMGIVTQTNFLFSGTVMENIRIGRPQASDAEVIAAARALDVLDLIEDMPDRFATQVGERGNNVSVGQRQVICFARAMLADPRILILDEATSAIDAITESRVQSALAVLLKGRTSFVVAHRLSTIRHADQVLVLDQGRIVERGTHTTLLDLNGIYAEHYRRFSQSSQLSP